MQGGEGRPGAQHPRTRPARRPDPAPATCAAPLPAGVAAVYLGDHPNASPLEVQQFLNGGATRDKIATAKLRPGTANRLLFSGGGGGGGTKVQAASGP